MLTKVNNKPMYMNVVKKSLKISFNKVILVTQYEEIKRELIEQPIEVVINSNSEKGISHSIKIAIERSEDSDAYMFMVCDQPFITIETIETLIDKFMKSNKGMACVEYKGKLGNPTIFSTKYKDELLSLQGDVGGKLIMKKHLYDLEIVPVVNGIELMDIDTKEQLESLKRKNLQ